MIVLSALFPALAFLLTGVPLAVLLDKLGFFKSAANFLIRKNPSLFTLWLFAAFTTAVLNLDTTIVLLTPLYIHIAKRAKIPFLPLITIPLLLASFASSLLPVSNLTNIIAVNKLHISIANFVSVLGIPTVISILTGWVFYKLRFPHRLKITQGDKKFDGKALTIGCIIVCYLLLGFILGSQIGLQAWMVALSADIVLVFITHSTPWRAIPIKTAIIIAVIAIMATILIPTTIITNLLTIHNPLLQITYATFLATLGANTINNIPTTIVGIQSSTHVTWGVWAWLIGVNVGAVLLPIGALANLLWKNIAKHNGIHISFREYLSITLPIGIPTLFLTFLVLLIESFLFYH